MAVGVPSALLANPFFVRMTPVPWWNYAAWVATSVLSGILAATYWHAPSAPGTPRRAGTVANIGSMLAVGCAVCKKLVVAALGVSGALGGAGVDPAGSGGGLVGRPGMGAVAQAVDAAVMCRNAAGRHRNRLASRPFAGQR